MAKRMIDSGRTLTLRGSLNAFIGSKVVEELALSYESPDRTKGWKVKGAWLWIDTLSQNTITANNNPVLAGALATDKVPTQDKNVFTSVDDNRLFGWTQVHYRGFDTNDYYVPHASTPSSQSFLLDLDRIVTNQLYVYAFMQTNGGATLPAPVKINYMIALEEVKVSPSQSLLQQLKGIGQDIDN